MLLMALGQKRMFDKPLVALLHLAVYAGFIIINIEILEIILDGIFGTHRLFAPYLGRFYTFVINFFEVLAFLVLTSCIIFLIRRNVVKVRRVEYARVEWLAAQRCQLHTHFRDCFNDAISDDERCR